MFKNVIIRETRKTRIKSRYVILLCEESLCCIHYVQGGRLRVLEVVWRASSTAWCRG